MAIATTESKKGHAEHTQAAQESLGLRGKFTRPIKITMLGAGSGFTPRLLNDVFHINGADRGEIALVDIDEDRLKTMHQLIGKLIDQMGKTGWKVTASKDRAEVLPGSDYIVNCIEVSGVDCVKWDNDIPLKYGIDQCIGDTIGPGGLFKALRTVPVFLQILKDAERLCPRAIVLNYTNPMNMMCLAAGRTSAMPVVGLCHSVQGTSQKLANDAGVPYDEMSWECAGINHLAWFTKLEHAGKSIYPILFDKVKDHAGEIFEGDPVRYDMMLHFGAFITESSGHLSEYLPYYRKRPEITKEYCREGYRGGSRFYASNWPTWRNNADADRMAMCRGEKEVGWERSWEYASWIIEAREKDSPFRIHGNVMNNSETGGQLITNLPADGCVEVACLVDRNGINPTRYGALPRQMAGICASNMAMFDLGAHACIDKSKEAAIHALMLDPLTAAICTPAQIKQMTLEMFEAEKEFLPGFK
ncbi:MAG: alpha-glucosidase/alpha-galactosidase [Anaerolineae bacterium]|nr:alpha-glucosidase/alpha-galactosidase [Phycisphaerae bacterium]